MNQDQFFFEKEGNAWFQRNKTALQEISKFDWPIEMIGQLKSVKPILKIAELGCSTGWRLAHLKRLFPEANFYGLDASHEAIEFGKRNYPGIHFVQGLLNNIPWEEAFDLVIINFVLHWVDRKNLAKTISEIDRVVNDDGFLILSDFFPNYAVRRKYHHAPQENIFTYKQKYGDIFSALGCYKEISRVTFNHDNPAIFLSPTNHQSRAFCSLFNKSFTEYYSESL